MVESSRDTTQLIRLVYASTCGGERWGCSEREWSGAKKENRFLSPLKCSFFLILIEWVLKVTSKTRLEYMAYWMWMQLNGSFQFLKRTHCGNLDIHYGLTFCPLHISPSLERLKTKQFLICTQKMTYWYNKAVFDFILPRGKLWVGLTY